MGNTRTFYRDGLEETITGPIRVSVTSDGHIIEKYTLSNGKKRYFATLAGTHWCAHGDTIANAITDAVWKDPAQRPSQEALVKSIQAEGPSRKITLNEFRLLTGACLTGCMTVLNQAKKDTSPLTAAEILALSQEWGEKLFSLLEWKRNC